MEKDIQDRELINGAFNYSLGLADSGNRNNNTCEWDLLKIMNKKFESKDSEQNIMEDINNLLLKLDEEDAAGHLTLDSLARLFGNLQRRYPAVDYNICQFSHAMGSFALPLFIKLFQGWDPLQDPTHGVYVVSIWKDLLRDSDGVYTRLFTQVVSSALKVSVTDNWEASNPEPMLQLIHSWQKLIPPSSALQSELDDIVLAKLSSVVDSWDPLLESTVPIHVLIQPWLPLLGHKLDTLLATVRIKLEGVLRAWHPSDASAYSLLIPWKTVFDDVSWENLTARFILPKLLAVMNEFVVDPKNQKFEKLDWVLRWATAIPRHHLIQLLAVFFDKWQLVLYWRLFWNPDIKEVTHWYWYWCKYMHGFDPELRANAYVWHRFDQGLEMIIQAELAAERIQVVQEVVVAACYCTFCLFMPFMCF